jgi:hypothetical protein
MFHNSHAEYLNNKFVPYYRFPNYMLSSHKLVIWKSDKRDSKFQTKYPFKNILISIYVLTYCQSNTVSLLLIDSPKT